jgi:hypothetical protein
MTPSNATSVTTFIYREYSDNCMMEIKVMERHWVLGNILGIFEALDKKSATFSFLYEKCLLCIYVHMVAEIYVVGMQKATQLQTAKASTKHGKENVLRYFPLLYML